MISFLKTSALAAGIAISMFASSVSAEPVYLIAQIEVEDFDKFRSTYGQAVLPILMERGIEILAGGGEHKLLEGEWGYNHTVILKFESEEAAMDFYDSPEYVAARPLRFAATSANNLILVHQFVMPTQ